MRAPTANSYSRRSSRQGAAAALGGLSSSPYQSSQSSAAPVTSVTSPASIAGSAGRLPPASAFENAAYSAAPSGALPANTSRSRSVSESSFARSLAVGRFSS